VTSELSHHPPEETWVAAIYWSSDGADRCGTGVLVTDRTVLTCRHILTDGDEAGADRPLWVAFPKSDGGSRRRYRAGPPVLSAGEHDLALLGLEDDPPGGVVAAPVRCPVPSGLIGKRWWAFGFPDGYPRGNDAAGTVGAALTDGCVRIDSRPESESRYRLLPGFSGAGLWSPDYQAIVGIVITANEYGDGEAVTLHQADLCFPDHKLRELARASATDAGEAAMMAWGWTLDDDPEAGRHWRPRARGVTRDSERGYRFRGRAKALKEIVGWLDRAETDRRVLLVTGSPGVGKSAVLGRIVTTADPGLRVELPAADPAVRATPGSVACAVHAKGKTALEVATEIARAASAALPDRLDDLVPAVREALADRDGVRFNLVIDALDEASSPAEARLIVREIASPLVEDCADVGAQVVIGSRRADGDGDLLRAFANPTVLIDLDLPEYFQLDDLAGYVLATVQLSGAERPDNPYADDEVATPVAERIAELSDRNFLIAGLTALSHGLHDTTAVQPGDLSFTPKVSDALRAYLRRLPPIAGIPAATVLTGLAFAEAPGLPIGLWTLAVKALTGQEVAARDLAAFAQSSAANFLVESSGHDSGRAFRLFHQALNEALLADRHQHSLFVDDEHALTRAFIDHGREVGWAAAPRYLLRSLPTHADWAGLLDELLTDDDYLLHADLLRLVPLGDHATTHAGRNRARLLRLTPNAVTADPRTRTAMFSVTETLEGLGSAYTDSESPGPHRARWAVTTPRMERAVLEGHSGDVAAVCALPASDGRTLLVSGSFDRTLRIWDLDTGSVLHTLEGDIGVVSGVCALPAADGRILLASGDGQMVRVWDPDTGTLLRTLGGHLGVVSGVCALPAADGRILLASGDDQMVRVWDPDTGTLLRTLGDDTGRVTGVCALPAADGRTLLASGGRTVRIWDPDTGTLLRTLGLGTWGVFAVCALSLPGGRTLLASGGVDQTVRIWDPDTGSPLHTLGGHTDEVTAVCALPTPAGHTLLASGGDQTVRIWDPDTGNLLRTLKSHDYSVSHLCALPVPDGRILLASGGGDQTVRIWDPDTGSVPHARESYTSCANAVCVLPMPDGRTLLASANEDQPVRIWDPDTGTLLRTLDGHTGGENAVCALPMPDGRTLLAGDSLDGTVQIWDPDTGTLLHTLYDGTSGVYAVCALPMPDGRILLAIGSADATVQIWDTDTDTPLHTLQDHSSVVAAVCALPAPDGRTLLASGGYDGTVRIWDPDDGRMLQTIHVHHQTYAIAYAANALIVGTSAGLLAIEFTA
jgi:WD40 repeat protein